MIYQRHIICSFHKVISRNLASIHASDWNSNGEHSCRARMISVPALYCNNSCRASTGSVSHEHPKKEHDLCLTCNVCLLAGDFDCFPTKQAFLEASFATEQATVVYLNRYYLQQEHLSRMSWLMRDGMLLFSQRLLQASNLGQALVIEEANNWCPVVKKYSILVYSHSKLQCVLQHLICDREHFRVPDSETKRTPAIYSMCLFTGGHRNMP